MEDYMMLSNNIIYSDSQNTNKMDFDYYLAELDKAKQLLSFRQREIFEMNKEKGLSVKEIMEELNLTEQSVRNQLSVSLKIMREQLRRIMLSIFAFLFLPL